MTPSISTVRRRWTASRAFSIYLGVLIGAAPLTACSADPTPAPTPATTSVPGVRTIALFPAANDAGADGDIAASAVDSAVKWRLNSSGTYQATSFNVLLPAVQRALTLDSSDEALSSTDVQAPITSAASAQKIARVMATDGYLLYEIDTYQEDKLTHDISITASGSLFSTSTGEAARSFAFTGTATPQTADEGADTVMLRAADVVASDIATTLGAGANQGKSTIPNSKIGGSSAIGSGILIVLAAALIGIIAHNANDHSSTGSSTSSSSSTGGSGSSGSGGFGGPPPPP